MSELPPWLVACTGVVSIISSVVLGVDMLEGARLDWPDPTFPLDHFVPAAPLPHHHPMNTKLLRALMILLPPVRAARRGVFDLAFIYPSGVMLLIGSDCATGWLASEP